MPVGPLLYANEADSLKQLLPTQTGKDRVKTLNQLCWELRNSQPDSALKFGLEAEKIADSIQYKKGIMKAKSFVGVVFRNLGYYAEALDYYNSGLELAKELNDMEQQGYAMINLGNLLIYQGNYDKAIAQLKEAITVSKSANNQKIQAYVALNLGRAYLKKGKLPLALMSLDNAIEYRTAINDLSGLAVCYKYKGDVYSEQENYELANLFYHKTIETGDLKEDIDLFADLYERMGFVALKNNKLKEAEQKARESLKLAEEIKSKLRIKNAHALLFEIAKHSNDYKSAVEHQTSVTLYNDSIYNEQLSQKIASIQYSAEQKQKQIKINMLNKDLQLQDLLLQRQKTISFVLSGAIILFVVLSIILWKIIRERNRANEELSEKNVEIETQNQNLIDLNDTLNTQRKQITDSINYAQRIQQALFPSEQQMSFFKEYSIFLKPRDIVSGDFYWVQQIDHDRIILAVADCTGHGIPGAFMSMLGISFLQDISKNDIDKIAPNKMLDKLRDRIMESLGQTGKVSDNKDGMDMALVYYNKTTRQLQYAGAHMPMIIYSQGELIEIKADRMPISFSRKSKPFDLQVIDLKPNDMVYFYSDGIVDQLDERKKERFKRYRLRNVIEQSADLPAPEQQKRLIEKLDKWHTHSDQTDDMLFLAFRVE